MSLHFKPRRHHMLEVFLNVVAPLVVGILREIILSEYKI